MLQKKAFSCDAIGINSSEVRKWSYHLFVWPVGTCLDNNIFSGNSEHCKGEVSALKLEADHASNPFKNNMNGIAVTWKIGVVGGEHFEDDGDILKTDLLSMF